MHVLAWIVPVLGLLIWRNGRVLKHNVLTKSAFPIGYYASGNFDKDCSPLVPLDTPEYHPLKFCEDGRFWDVHDTAGKLQQRHLILSCDPNRKSWNTVMGPLRDPNPQGALWLYTPASYSNKNVGAPEPVQLKLKNYPVSHDFHPLGLDIWPSHGGNTSHLFVVNHARRRTTIEQFSLSPNDISSATYIRTLTSPYFVSPNALTMTSPTSFYVSNDHLLTRRLPWPLGAVLPVVETLLGLPLGFLSHISLDPNATDPSSPPVLHHSLSALGIPFANGVALSPDGTTVALAATSLGQILFYTREPSNNTIQHTHSVPVPFCPDNVAYDSSGALIVAGHPHFPSIVSVAANKTGAVGPSWVTSIIPRLAPPKRPAKGKKSDITSLFAPSQEYDMQAPISARLKAPAMLSHEVETLFQSNGTGFSTSSTALRDAYTGELYITGLYAEEGVIVCKPNLTTTSR